MRGSWKRGRGETGENEEGKAESIVPILVFVLLVNAAHQGGGRWQDLVDEDEDGLLGRELDTLSDDVYELADGEVGGNEVLLLIDSSDVTLLDFLADDLSKRRDIVSSAPKKSG